MSSIVSCPYTGAVVSRPEECAEFAGDGRGGGGSGGSEKHGSASNYGEQLDSNVQGAVNKIKACVVNPANSVFHEYWSDVKFEFVDLGAMYPNDPRMSDALGAASCNPLWGKHTIYLDRGKIESTHNDWKTAGWNLTIWDVASTTLTHEFLHVETFELYGCRPWTRSARAKILTRAGFAASRDGENNYITQETSREFKEVFWR